MVYATNKRIYYINYNCFVILVISRVISKFSKIRRNLWYKVSITLVPCLIFIDALFSQYYCLSAYAYILSFNKATMHFLFAINYSKLDPLLHHIVVISSKTYVFETTTTLISYSSWFSAVLRFLKY